MTTQSKEPTQVWDTPAAIYVLTGEDIRRSGVTSIPDALRLVPGVNVARVNGSRNWAVGIRGFGDQFSKYVLVLIDGRSVYTPLFGGVLWTIDNVMLEDIDRIEVIRGPGGTIWGADAVNGIINIITKHSQDTKGTLLSSGGGNVDQNTEDARYGSAHKNWTWRTNAFGFVRSPEFHVDGQPAYDWSRFGQAGFRADRAKNSVEFTFQGDAYWGKFGDAQSSVYLHSTRLLHLLPVHQCFRGQSARPVATTVQQSFRHLPSDVLVPRSPHRLELRRRPRYLRRRLPASPRCYPLPAVHVRPRTSAQPQHRYADRAHRYLRPTAQDGQHLQRICSGRTTSCPKQAFTHRSVPSSSTTITPVSNINPTRGCSSRRRQKFSAWASVSRAVRTPDRVDEDIQVDIFAIASPLIFARVIGNHDLSAERLIAYEGGLRTLLHPRFYISAAGFYNAYRNLIAQGSPIITVAPRSSVSTFGLSLHFAIQ